MKTDAPPEVVWDIVRCWVVDHPVKMLVGAMGGGGGGKVGAMRVFLWFLCAIILGSSKPHSLMQGQ